MDHLKVELMNFIIFHSHTMLHKKVTPDGSERGDVDQRSVSVEYRCDHSQGSGNSKLSVSDISRACQVNNSISTDRLRAILVAEDFFDHFLIKTASKRADNPLKFLRAQHISVMISIIEAAMGLSSINESQTSQATRFETEP